MESHELKTKFYCKISINYSRVFCHDTLGSWYFSFVSLAVLPSFLFLCFKHRKHIFRKRTSFLISVGMFFLSIIRLTLIVICNPSIINPGPWQPNILYQNVQGLIPFGELGKTNPVLNLDKILELQSYVNINRPDIIVLNETWLKKSISDNEILPTRQYKLFRVDRTEESHPPDPDNPNKFRRNGGGVLIAIRTDLDVISKKLKIKAAAELLAVQVKLSNGTTYVFSTCYRVGTLGKDNHDVVTGVLHSILAKIKPPKLFLIGDFNLSCTDWLSKKSSNTVEQQFIDSFSELGLNQCVSNPTHTKGNTLDILLTNSENYVSNLGVMEPNSVCFSDHFPIKFSVRGHVRQKKMPKREFFNLKKQNGTN